MLKKLLQNLLQMIMVTLLIPSCTPISLAVGSLTVGTAAVQEKSIGSAVDDSSIWTKIKKSFVEEKDNNLLLKNINVKVDEGRVLLTGSVPSAEDRLRALKIVWSITGVKEVINEIKIDYNDDKNILASYSIDTWITTQIKSKLLFTANIRSINYSIETIDKVVYLIGIAQDDVELNKVVDIAGTVQNVIKVISYVRIKDSESRMKMLHNTL